jgi:hypothetical protein
MRHDSEKKLRLAGRNLQLGLNAGRSFVKIESNPEVGELRGMIFIETTHSKTYNGLLAGVNGKLLPENL